MKFWRAFYVKPRHEKKVSERLSENGFEVFCPLIKTKVKWHDRWKKVYKPWINGYVFAHVDETERIQLLQDSSVVSTVCERKGGVGKPAVIRDKEIEAMKLMTKQAKTVETRELRKGQKVNIAHGPMAGFIGIIDEINNTTLGIRLESLNMQLVITIESQDISLS